MAIQKVAIFTKGKENFNLSVAIVVAAISLASIFVVDSNLNQQFRHPAISFVFNVLLLSITHNAFSFVLPLVSPEVRTWWNESRWSGLSVSAVMLMIFVFSFALIYGLFTAMDDKDYRIWAIYIFAIVTLCLEFRHSLGQMYGFSRIYDHRSEIKFGKPDENTLRLRNFQRIGFKLLFVIVVCSLAITRISQNKEFIDLSTKVSIIVIMGLVLLMIAASIKETKGKNSNKPLYLSRLMVFASVATGGPLTLYLYLFIHSTEYSLLAYTMVKNSYQRGKEMKVLRYWGLGILVVLIFVLAAQARYQILGPTIARSFPESYELLKVLSAVSFSLTFCHFFLDEMMFKMKNPQVRQQIAKLLSEEPV